MLEFEAERLMLRHFGRDTKKPYSGHFGDALRSLFFPGWTLHFGMGWTASAHALFALTVNPSGA